MKYIVYIVLVVLISACSTPSRAYIQSYEGMRKVENNLYFSNVKDANLSSYNKIFIPEVKVMVNEGYVTPTAHQLSVEIKAYTTPAYRKLISKNSSNYELVDIGQKNTMVMQIALSLAYIDEDKKGLEALTFVPFVADDTDKKLYLVVEVVTTDVMTLKVLARTIRIIKDEEIDVKNLSFKDVQASLDSWLSSVIKH